MRSRIPAGVLLSLALLIPAAPAAAHAASPRPNGACQTAERKVYKDIRELVTIDLDTAPATDVRLLANQILAAANADSLLTLAGRMQERLDGTADDLRAFLKTNMRATWSTDLRVAVNQVVTGAGAHVKAAGQKVLDDGTIDALLAFLNDGLYVARAQDCATQPAPPSSASTSSAPVSSPASPGRTATSAPTAGATSGTTTTSTAVVPAPTTAPSTSASGSMPVTGTNTGVIAAIGGILLFLGGASILLARRRRAAAGE